MNKAQIRINRAFTVSAIDPRLFGSFVEHMGRVVYTGIYEKDHPTADADGFRQDVLQLTREMGVTAVRYPGGNFVSGYSWTDGIGPREQRPKRRSLAWKSIETNEIGIDEFMVWARKAGVEPVLAVNLGTKGIEEAVNFLEYCNGEPGTLYSDLRAQNATPQPYGVRTWCLGNEMDGDWQIGHKTAGEYGRLAHETGKAMKIIDPSVQLVVCGSSLSTNATVGEWDRTVMRHCFGEADFISLHQYYGGQEKGTAAFLAQSLDLENYIRMAAHVCDVEGFMRRDPKKVMIALDEWGVWSTPASEVEAETRRERWQYAPRIGEQIYTMEDSLLFASMLLAMIRAADRVKLACQSLLTNVSACIMTEPGGGVWVQPIYYVFALAARLGGGVVLQEAAEEDTYAVETFSQVPYVDHVSVWDEAKGELSLLLVNRGESAAEVTYSLEGPEAAGVLESTVLTADDRKATNAEDHERIRPAHIDNVKIEGSRITCELLPLSFQMVRISLR